MNTDKTFEDVQQECADGGILLFKVGIGSNLHLCVMLLSDNEALAGTWKSLEGNGYSLKNDIGDEPLGAFFMGSNNKSWRGLGVLCFSADHLDSWRIVHETQHAVYHVQREMPSLLTEELACQMLDVTYATIVRVLIHIGHQIKFP